MPEIAPAPPDQGNLWLFIRRTIGQEASSGRIKNMESTGNIDKPMKCNRCGGAFTVRQLIIAIEKCYPLLEVVSAKTPCCQSVEELWLRNGLASRGYVYAAGQAHFADMEQYDAPDMTVVYAPRQATIRLGHFEKSLERL